MMNLISFYCYYFAGDPRDPNPGERIADLQIPKDVNKNVLFNYVDSCAEMMAYL